MTTLTPAQIATYAAGAGFRGSALTTAVAVALAESGGRTDAVGVNSDSYRSRDRGLWQINDHWHPDVSDSAAFNPAACARAAYRISSKGTDWSPWSTWKSGVYLAHMGRARLAAGKVNQSGAVPVGDELPYGGHKVAPDPGLDDLGGVVGGAADIAASYRQALVLAVHAGAWMSDPHNWVRVAMVAGGSIALLTGLTLLAKSGAAGSTAAKAGAIPGVAAKAAVPVAKLGKAAKVAKGAALAKSAATVTATK